jgi:hypothetical protein
MLRKPRTKLDQQLLDDLNAIFKSHGFKVMTGDWWKLDNFDAIVLPPLEVLEERLRGEERPGHDPRETDALIRRFNLELVEPKPIFETIEEALAFLGGG